ncbi:MAG: signal recognition particle subunit SRP19/SEC65 family protein [Euryarchaeota archaeon]|nr:signal recognition particle subunit SRP19/SEC65 family protein [Euryarchaeota archaeon]
MPETDRIVIWPIYFDSRLSRNDGRRVSRRSAVKSPRLDEIAEAARLLNLDCTVEVKKAHPAAGWEKQGRALVKKAGASKSSILYEVGSKMKELRSTN